jgi:thymidylate synthase
MSYNDFLHFYARTNANVYVIGGGEIYNTFLKNAVLKPRMVYITEVKGLQDLVDNPPDTFMNALDQSYRLISVSEKHYTQAQNTSYRFLTYKWNPDYVTEESKYINLCKDIILRGEDRNDRTGVGTVSQFGTQLRFDISSSIPLLTTKRVSFESIVEELLFFCRGNTDANLLKDRGVHIWDRNTSREFLDGRGLYHYQEGIMGPMYGWNWRNFGAQYSQAFSDLTCVDQTKLSGFDQLEHIENLLKTDPLSRRIYLTSLNPAQSSQMVLEPCHVFFQLYVTESCGQKYLSGHFVMRSNDLGCGFPYNLVSYSVLVYILAARCGMKPKEIVYSCSDCHVYKNHFEQMSLQFSREPRPFPKLILNPEIKNKSWNDMSIDDFDLVGYLPHNFIKFPMAV